MNCILPSSFPAHNIHQALSELQTCVARAWDSSLISYTYVLCSLMALGAILMHGQLCQLSQKIVHVYLACKHIGSRVTLQTSAQRVAVSDLLVFLHPAQEDNHTIMAPESFISSLVHPGMLLLPSAEGVGHKAVSSHGWLTLVASCQHDAADVQLPCLPYTHSTISQLQIAAGRQCVGQKFDCPCQV